MGCRLRKKNYLIHHVQQNRRVRPTMRPLQLTSRRALGRRGANDAWHACSAPLHTQRRSAATPGSSAPCLHPLHTSMHGAKLPAAANCILLSACGLRTSEALLVIVRAAAPHQRASMAMQAGVQARRGHLSSAFLHLMMKYYSSCCPVRTCVLQVIASKRHPHTEICGRYP